MATFCFKCRLCGKTAEQATGDPGTWCFGLPLGYQHFAEPMVRDYQAEGVGIGSGVRVSRDGTESDINKLFLPGNDEFVGPGDPDGTKGMRDWHDKHQPKEGAGDRGKVPGRIEKRSF